MLVSITYKKTSYNCCFSNIIKKKEKKKKKKLNVEITCNPSYNYFLKKKIIKWGLNIIINFVLCCSLWIFILQMGCLVFHKL